MTSAATFAEFPAGARLVRTVPAYAWALSLLAHAALAGLGVAFIRADAPRLEPVPRPIEATIRTVIATPEPEHVHSAVERAPAASRRAPRESVSAAPPVRPREEKPAVTPVLSIHAESPAVVAAPQAAAPAAPVVASPQPAVRKEEAAAEPPPKVAMVERRGERHRDVAYKHNPVPPYPPAARRLGLEGTVQMRVLVSASGQAEKIELAQSSGMSLLDEAAVSAVRGWSFTPAIDDYEPIAHWVSFPINFTLERKPR